MSDKVFSVTPNPASDKLTINIDSKTDDNWSARLMNSVGQTLFSKVGQNTNSFEVNVANFSNGLYFVEYQIGAEKKVEKVVIQH